MELAGRPWSAAELNRSNLHKRYPTSAAACIARSNYKSTMDTVFGVKYDGGGEFLVRRLRAVVCKANTKRMRVVWGPGGCCRRAHPIDTMCRGDGLVLAVGVAAYKANYIRHAMIVLWRWVDCVRWLSCKTQDVPADPCVSLRPADADRPLRRLPLG